MLDRLEFLFGEAFVALRRNGLMTFAAISTVAVALFLLGGLGYVYFRVSSFAAGLPTKFDLRIFLKDGTTVDQIKDTAKQIRALDGVKTAVWVPRDKAWEKWKKDYPDQTQGLDNPFPDAFKVTLAEVSKAAQVRDKLEGIATVQEGGVKYDDNAQRLLSESLALVRWLGGALGGLLFLTSGILIYNAIRLTVVARRREIRIMQLVGASHFTIRTPFLIEGLVQGAIGGILASGLLYFANQSFQRFVETLSSLGNVPPFPIGLGMLSLLAIGALYGFGCSLIALREPLRFR